MFSVCKPGGAGRHAHGSPPLPTPPLSPPTPLTSGRTSTPPTTHHAPPAPLPSLEPGITLPIVGLHLQLCAAHAACPLAPPARGGLRDPAAQHDARRHPVHRCGPSVHTPPPGITPFSDCGSPPRPVQICRAPIPVGPACHPVPFAPTQPPSRLPPAPPPYSPTPHHPKNRPPTLRPPQYDLPFLLTRRPTRLGDGSVGPPTPTPPPLPTNFP